MFELGLYTDGGAHGPAILWCARTMVARWRSFALPKFVCVSTLKISRLATMFSSLFCLFQGLVFVSTSYGRLMQALLGHFMFLDLLLCPIKY